MKSGWAVVFLIYADFVSEKKDGPKLNENLLLELNSLLGDIFQSELNDTLSIYVIFSSVNYSALKGTDQFELRNLSFIFKMINKDGNNQIICMDSVDAKGVKEEDAETEINSIQKKEKIASAFKKIQEDNNRDTEILLITWDHGSAFGIFKADDHRLQVLQTWNSISSNPNFYYISLFLQVADEYLRREKHAIQSQSVDNQGYLFNKRVFSLADTGRSSEKVLMLLKERNEGNKFSINKNELGYWLGPNRIIKEEHISAIQEKFKSQGINELNDTVENFFISSEKVENKGVVEILTNDELADAINEGFGDSDKGQPGKVGVLLMMNCYMMNLHTVYAMRGRADFLVAPQGIISTPGYNYADILRCISHGGSRSKIISPGKLAKFCVDSCHNLRARRRAEQLKEDFTTIDEWSIFSVGLKENESSYIGFLDDFVDELNKTIEGLFREIDLSDLEFLLLYSKRFCFDFSEGSYHMTDISHWVNNVQFAGLGVISENADESISVLIEKLGNLLKQDTEDYNAWRGKRYGRATSGAVVASKQSGLCIFFPHIPRKNVVIPFHNFEKDELLSGRLTNWNRFLDIITTDVVI
jgi:hypothetical protein